MNAARAEQIMEALAKLYPEARHEILNEINRAEVFADFVARMNEMVK